MGFRSETFGDQSRQDLLAEVGEFFGIVDERECRAGYAGLAETCQLICNVIRRAYQRESPMACRSTWGQFSDASTSSLKSQPPPNFFNVS